ncbi:hypothetical protein BASA81_016383 [Batrachochytrium salamandrivorans]|nr:hypothetical protein BASA81_016383 [Batrachochytrium salamandrivorans]
MYKVEILKDNLQNAAIERRQRLDEERKQRIFNPRVRVMGIDLQALDEQIQIKNKLKAIDKKRNDNLDSTYRHNNDILQLMDEHVIKARRHQLKQTNQFRQTFNNLINAVIMICTILKHSRKITLLVKSMAAEKRRKEQQDKVYETELNTREILSHVNGAFLTEKSDMLNTSGSHKVCVSQFKGNTVEQNSKIMEAQQQQRMDHQKLRAAQIDEDERWANSGYYV